MQAQAAELSGYAGNFHCFLDASIVKKALEQTRSVCLRAF
jgi:hypothetical protein